MDESIRGIGLRWGQGIHVPQAIGRYTLDLEPRKRFVRTFWRLPAAGGVEGARPRLAFAAARGVRRGERDGRGARGAGGFEAGRGRSNARMEPARIDRVDQGGGLTALPGRC